MVPAVIVVGHPVNHFVHDLLARSEPASMQSIDLEPVSETLCGWVVPAVTLAANRTLHPVACKRLLKFMAAILFASVRMSDEPRLR